MKTDHTRNQTFFSKIHHYFKYNWSTVKILNRILKSSSLEVRRVKSHHSFEETFKKYRTGLSDRIARQLSHRVARGPFKGMQLPEGESWSDGDLAAKLVGIYEQELFPHIQTVVKHRPDCIVNIGCAEGYYTIGMKLLLNNAKAFGVDISDEAKDLFQECCQINNVDAQFCADFDLESCQLIEGFEKIAWLVDCEGCEVDLPKMPDHIKQKSIFIIECHDRRDGPITSHLLEWLGSCHDVSIIDEGSRNPHDIAEFAGLTSLEKYALTCEQRGLRQHWIVAVPRAWMI